MNGSLLGGRWVFVRFYAGAAAAGIGVFTIAGGREVWQGG
jgi:hypothetical protein